LTWDKYQGRTPPQSITGGKIALVATTMALALLMKAAWRTLESALEVGHVSSIMLAFQIWYSDARERTNRASRRMRMSYLPNAALIIGV
jgi:hypothetical protein